MRFQALWNFGFGKCVSIPFLFYPWCNFLKGSTGFSSGDPILDTLIYSDRSVTTWDLWASAFWHPHPQHASHIPLPCGSYRSHTPHNVHSWCPIVHECQIIIIIIIPWSCHMFWKVVKIDKSQISVIHSYICQHLSTLWRCGYIMTCRLYFYITLHYITL